MAYLLLTITVLFWSGNFVISRGVHEIISPISLAFWRWTTALIIIAPFSIKYLIKQKALIKQNWKLLTLLAIFSVTNFNTFIYLALQSNTVINTVLINSMTPIFIVFITWLGFKDKISIQQGIGGIISFAGLLWIITRGNPIILFSIQFSNGDLWTLAAGLSWAIYSALLRKRPPAIHPMTFLLYMIITGLICLLPFYFWELTKNSKMDFSYSSLGAIAYIGLFASVLAYLFWNKAVLEVGANKAGIFVHLMPVFSIILAMMFLNENIKAFHIPGMLLILLGIILTSIGNLKQLIIGYQKKPL